MENQFNFIKNDLLLEQSELFHDFYAQVNDTFTPTFNGGFLQVEDWYNNILNSNDFLNNDQIINLQQFFHSLKYILRTIDPKKLSFKSNINEDTDLMLWRESDFGISKLIFDEYGQIVYMFNGNDGKKVRGIFEKNVDMEKLLYRFISN